MLKIEGKTINGEVVKTLKCDTTSIYVVKQTIHTVVLVERDGKLIYKKSYPKTVRKSYTEMIQEVKL